MRGRIHSIHKSGLCSPQMVFVVVGIDFFLRDGDRLFHRGGLFVIPLCDIANGLLAHSIFAARPHLVRTFELSILRAVRGIAPWFLHP